MPIDGVDVSAVRRSLKELSEQTEQLRRHL
jgi:hypothetical protein